MGPSEGKEGLRFFLSQKVHPLPIVEDLSARFGVRANFTTTSIHAYAQDAIMQPRKIDNQGYFQACQVLLGIASQRSLPSLSLPFCNGPAKSQKGTFLRFSTQPIRPRQTGLFLFARPLFPKER